MGNCFLYKRGFGGASGGAGGGGSTPEVEKTASGKVISIHDSMEKPLKGLRLFGKTTQNGTPSPDAPVPLESVGDGGSIVVSVAGKNLLNSTKFSWRTALPTKIDTQFLTCQLPAGEYVLSIKSNTGIMRINVIAVNLVDAEYKTVKSINGGSKNGINGSSVFSLTEEEAAKGNTYVCDHIHDDSRWVPDTTTETVVIQEGYWKEVD